MTKQPKHPNNRLTLVIRDPAPAVFMGDSPAYRTVLIELTPEQVEKIALRHLGVNCGTDIYEEISQTFIEPDLTYNAEAQLPPVRP